MTDRDEVVDDMLSEVAKIDSFDPECRFCGEGLEFDEDGVPRFDWHVWECEDVPEYLREFYEEGSSSSSSSQSE